MTADTAVVAVAIGGVALGIGLIVGMAIARRRVIVPEQPAPVVDLRQLDAGEVPNEDDTRPTLIPFRAARDAGRSAVVVDAEAEAEAQESAEANRQLDRWIADLDRPHKR
ncbi:MAG: hypothetical protein ABMB14_37325 [Myxococcota bacterium]